MARIVVVPPSPRHPHERYQMCYQDGKRPALGRHLPDQAASARREAAIERGSLRRPWREVPRVSQSESICWPAIHWSSSATSMQL